jgi:hypothetical protein
MKLDDVTTLVDLKYDADKTTYWYVMDVASNGFDAKDFTTARRTTDVRK